jgi:hypothetical protein
MNVDESGHDDHATRINVSVLTVERRRSAFAGVAYRTYARACDDKIGSLLVAHGIYQPSALQGALHIVASHLRYAFVLDRAISSIGGEVKPTLAIFPGPVGTTASIRARRAFSEAATRNRDAGSAIYAATGAKRLTPPI